MEVFLRDCLKRLDFFGIGYLGFNTIINTISIARYVDATWFLKEIRKFLRYQLLGKHPRTFSYITYLYPKFVVALIDIMPEIFDKFFWIQQKFVLLKMNFNMQCLKSSQIILAFLGIFFSCFTRKVIKRRRCQENCICLVK